MAPSVSLSSRIVENDTSIQFIQMSGLNGISKMYRPLAGCCRRESLYDAGILFLKGCDIEQHNVASEQTRSQKFFDVHVKDLGIYCALNVRRAKARTARKLIKALAKAIEKVTIDDLCGWFGHSGYTFSFI